MLVKYHGNKIVGLPHLTQGTPRRQVQGAYTFLKPGTCSIPEDVLQDYKNDGEIRALIFKGSLGGIELLGDGGGEHEAELAKLYQGQAIPSASERVATATAAMSAEFEFHRRGQSADPGDEFLDPNMPITAPEHE